MRDKKARYAIAAVAAIVLVLPLLSTCEKTLGSGVLMWTYSDGEIRIPSGTIVPVYLQSNIDRVYVIGASNGKKVEVPFWQVRLFGSYGEARSYVESMGNLASMYAIALRDGLPIRKEPDNRASQAYRLRVNEAVKLLEKVEGEVVMTGKEALPGDWYRVLAQDGTEGFIFSYTVQMYDEAREAAPSGAAGASDADKRVAEGLDALQAKTWRPESFRKMIDTKAYDLDVFKLQYGLFLNESGQVRLETPEYSRAFKYSKVAIDGKDGALVFGDSGLRVLLTGTARAEARFPDPKKPSENIAIVFVPVAEDVRDLADKETRRRQKALEDFVARGSAFSGAAGELKLFASGDFTWSGYEASGALPAGSGSAGVVKVRLVAAPSLASTYEIVLSFKFSGGSAWHDFAVRRTSDGIALVPVTAASLDGALMDKAPLETGALEFVASE
jgi:hypothetical protein